MTTLRIGTTLLIVKYLTNNHGNPYYQRRIPDDLQARFGKKKFSIPLDANKGSAAFQAQRLAKSHDALFKALRADPNMALSEEKLAALALLQTFGLAQGDGNVHLAPVGPDGETQPHLDHFGDYIIETARERNLTPTEEFARRALRRPLPALLSELPALYLSSHSRGKQPAFISKTNEYWSKLLGFVGDMPVESFTRDQARAFRDHREQQGVKSQTIQKDINIIKAIFEAGIRELQLHSRNPFEHIRANNLGKDAQKREVFDKTELRQIVDVCLSREDEIRRIILLQLISGARIGEIVGLRKDDCHLDDEIPFIQFVEYGNRTLKTKNSRRDVPLIHLGVQLLRRQMAESSSQALFPRYNNLTDAPQSDNASATINKWLRSSLRIQKTTHSFRHTVKDLLRDANVTQELGEQLLGHSAQTIAKQYGKGYAMSKRLDALRTALALALEDDDYRIFG